MSMPSRKTPSVREPNIGRGKIVIQREHTNTAKPVAEMTTDDVRKIINAPFTNHGSAAIFENLIAEKIQATSERITKKARKQATGSRLAKMSDAAQKVITAMVGYMTANEIADKTGQNISNVHRELKAMFPAGDVVREGKARPYRYKLSPKMTRQRQAAIVNERRTKIRGVCLDTWLTAHAIRTTLGISYTSVSADLAHMVENGQMTRNETKRGINPVSYYKTKTAN